MDTITVKIGSIVTGNSGQTNDTRRDVQFVGEELGSRTEYGEGRDGGITDTRGTIEALYRTEDGRLLVHVNAWSKWQGEPDVLSLHQVTEADLQLDGQFELLGAECGFGRPLTLEEALHEGSGDADQD